MAFDKVSLSQARQAALLAASEVISWNRDPCSATRRRAQMITYRHDIPFGDFQRDGLTPPRSGPERIVQQANLIARIVNIEFRFTVRTLGRGTSAPDCRLQAAARALTILSGPEGLALTNSTRICFPARSRLSPKRSPASNARAATDAGTLARNKVNESRTGDILRSNKRPLRVK